MPAAAEEARALPDHLILFDGVCNLCNGAVRFIIQRDRRQIFHFATLQSETARRLLGADGTEDAITLVYWRHGRPLVRSTAALHVARELSGAWPLAYGLILVPRFLRDALYNYVARNRYRWYGRRETCMLPDPGLAARFLP